MDILDLRHLKKYFSTQKAVDDISLSVPGGGIFGLLGPNGAGKTTLIRMITGIFYPDEGEILFRGKKFDADHDGRYIGYMPEERGLYKKMKIGAQALYLAQLKGLSRAEATEKIKFWFTRLQMESWWDKKVEELSKGMGQKLQFVITVLHEPDLIILDEPFSGLDPINANLIKDEIYRLAENGKTIIFSTHRMEQVEEICDHIVLVNKGKKILDGTVRGVKQEFKKDIFGIQLADRRQGDSRQADSGQTTRSPSPAFELAGQKDQELLVKINKGYGPNDVLGYFINQGNQIVGFREILPTLDDIFINVVEGTPTARQFEKTT